MALQLEILTPSKVLLTGEADEIVAPATEGEVGILQQHTDYVTTLGQGMLKVKQGAGSKDFQINGGLLTISHDQVKILVDEINE